MQQTYQCRQCGQSFRSQQELEEHTRRTHGQQHS
ncbi:MAG TPA: C2H2-type zinc finger protein [Dehalococcoidia bacterium]|nr:C2H2-type zinc finger protein [Dehalococcoidia bacterium]